MGAPSLLVREPFSTTLGNQCAVLAAAGMWIGAGAIVVHLLGDVITKGGLQPLLPFSRWKLRFSPLSYDNRIANTGLYALGWLAIVAAVASLLGIPEMF